MHFTVTAAESMSPLGQWCAFHHYSGREHVTVAEWVVTMCVTVTECLVSLCHRYRVPGRFVSPLRSTWYFQKNNPSRGNILCHRWSVMCNFLSPLVSGWLSPLQLQRVTIESVTIRTSPPSIGNIPIVSFTQTVAVFVKQSLTK